MWRYRNLSGGKILWRKKVAESTIWRKNSSNVAENIFKIHCIEKKLKYRLVKSWNMAVWRRKMAEFSKNIENGRRPFSKSGHYVYMFAIPKKIKTIAKNPSVRTIPFDGTVWWYTNTLLEYSHMIVLYICITWIDFRLSIIKRELYAIKKAHATRLNTYS